MRSFLFFFFFLVVCRHCRLSIFSDARQRHSSFTEIFFLLSCRCLLLPTSIAPFLFQPNGKKVKGQQLLSWRGKKRCRDPGGDAQKDCCTNPRTSKRRSEPGENIGSRRARWRRTTTNPRVSRCVHDLAVSPSLFLASPSLSVPLIPKRCRMEKKKRENVVLFFFYLSRSIAPTVCNPCPTY